MVTSEKRSECVDDKTSHIQEARMFGRQATAEGGQKARYREEGI